MLLQQLLSVVAKTHARNAFRGNMHIALVLLLLSSYKKKRKAVLRTAVHHVYIVTGQIVNAFSHRSQIHFLLHMRLRRLSSHNLWSMLYRSGRRGSSYSTYEQT